METRLSTRNAAVREFDLTVYELIKGDIFRFFGALRLDLNLGGYDSG